MARRKNAAAKKAAPKAPAPNPPADPVDQAPDPNPPADPVQAPDPTPPPAPAPAPAPAAAAPGRPGMTELCSNRDFTLRTLDGHTIRFQEDVPKFVPDKVVPEAMKFGAMPTGKLAKAAEPKAVTEPQGGDRQIAIRAAISDVMERNNRNDFGANSRPKAEVISSMVGFDVHEKELNALWESTE